jgi:hypothetical protein
MSVICPWGWSLYDDGTPETMLVVFSNEESERHVDSNCIYERTTIFAEGMDNLFIICPRRDIPIDTLVVYSFP